MNTTKYKLSRNLAKKLMDITKCIDNLKVQIDALRESVMICGSEEDFGRAMVVNGQWVGDCAWAAQMIKSGRKVGRRDAPRCPRWRLWLGRDGVRIVNEKCVKKYKNLEDFCDTWEHEGDSMNWALLDGN